MQKIIDNGTTVLLADDGKILANDSSFGKAVRLGKGDFADNWHEITEEEAEKLMNSEEATDEDYQSALREMGVKV